MKKNTACLVVLTALAAAGARADDPAKTEDRPKAEAPKDGERVKPAAPGQQKQIDKYAAEFGVTKEEVSGLRDKGLGWGEVRHALSLASKTGKPVGDILEMRRSGMGWGAIAEKEGVKLGPGHAGKGAVPRGAEPRGAVRDPGGRDRGRGRK
ncbi:MAG: hypothetical protein HY403_08705 [Elusimicrobia bacterium]|nr:hypothetical protein [Elusimicrobiota bacterium]